MKVARQTSSSLYENCWIVHRSAQRCTRHFPEETGAQISQANRVGFRMDRGRRCPAWTGSSIRYSSILLACVCEAPHKFSLKSWILCMSIVPSCHINVNFLKLFFIIFHGLQYQHLFSIWCICGKYGRNSANHERKKIMALRKGS